MFGECIWGSGSTLRWWGHLNTTCCNGGDPKTLFRLPSQHLTHRHTHCTLAHLDSLHPLLPCTITPLVPWHALNPCIPTPLVCSQPLHTLCPCTCALLHHCVLEPLLPLHPYTLLPHCTISISTRPQGVQGV